MTSQADDDDGDAAETSIGAVTNASVLSRFSRASFIGPSKFNVSIQLLDRNEKHNFEYKKSANGQNVLDDVCKFLNIAEKEFFGLQYEDNKFRYWLDLSKPLSKQFHRKYLEFRLRVRFYPSDPSCLKEAVTRYYLFVQIRRDLLHGRLSCSQNEAATLCGLILQASEGDYNEETMGFDADYVSGYQLIIKQSQKIEEKIAEAHKSFRGLTAEKAEAEFLNAACKLDTYAFDPHVVKNMGQTEEVVIGATSHGILLYIRGKKVHSLKWSEVDKVDYIGKQLTITPSKEYVANFIQHSPGEEADMHNSSLNSSLFDSSEHNVKSKGKKEQLKLVCPSVTYAKNLWRHILSQQVFFTEDNATSVKLQFSKPRIPLFSRGSTFRCPTSRVLHELELDSSPPRPTADNMFERQPLRRYTPRSVEESWNLSKSTSGYNSMERPADIGGTVIESPENNSTVPIAEEFCDTNAQSLLTNSDSKEDGNQNSPIKLLLNNAHPEDIHEKMTNGAFNLFGKNFSKSSIKNGISNKGYDMHSDENSEVSSTAKASLLVVVILFIFTAAFFVAFFFFPEHWNRAASHVQQLSSQIKIPPWIMPSSARK